MLSSVSPIDFHVRHRIDGLETLDKGGRESYIVRHRIDGLEI